MQPTVFHITHWKAGSQWIRAVLEEAAPERIVPPLPGQAHVFQSPIVPGGIYTPVYAGEEIFRAAVPAAANQRTFVVVRDPRDTLVSYYYSLLYSHGDDWDTVPEIRQILQEVDKTDGLAILLRGELCDVINIQITWLQAGADNIFYYEDLLRDEFRGFRDIFEFCQINITERRLREIVAKHSFQRVSGRAPGVADPRSHLRNGQAGDWRNHFPPQLISLFRILYGDATVRMGYASPARASRSRLNRAGRLPSAIASGSAPASKSPPVPALAMTPSSAPRPASPETCPPPTVVAGDPPRVIRNVR